MLIGFVDGYHEERSRNDRGHNDSPTFDLSTVRKLSPVHIIGTGVPVFVINACGCVCEK